MFCRNDKNQGRMAPAIVVAVILVESALMAKNRGDCRSFLAGITRATQSICRKKCHKLDVM
jgi:hypothetical protein